MKRLSGTLRRGAMGIAVGVGGALAGSSWVSSASACTRLFVPELIGEPADGATGVPTNVVPYYDTYAGWSANAPTEDAFRLESDSGQSVAFSLSTRFDNAIELVPDRELEPDTEYTLTAQTKDIDGATELSLSFVTGEGPVNTRPSVPNAAVEHYHYDDSARSSCDPQPTGSCIGLGHGETLAVFYETGSAPSFLFREAAWLDLYGNQRRADCVEVRRRGADGSLSNPQLLCRDDGSLVQLETLSNLRCTADGFVSGNDDAPGHAGASGQHDWDAEAEAADDTPQAGCTLRSPHNGAAAWVLLGALGVGAHLRRRARSLR